MLRKHLKTIATVAGVLCLLYVGYYLNAVVHVGDRDVRFIGISVLIIVALFVVACLPLVLRWAEHDARRKVLKESTSGAINRVHQSLRPRDRWPGRPSGLGSFYRHEEETVPMVREEPTAVLPLEVPQPRRPKSTDVPGVDELGLAERVQREMDLRLEGFHAGQFAAEEEKKRRPPGLGPTDEEAT